MLNQWLRWQPIVPNPYKKFSIIHVDHIDQLQPAVQAHLLELMLRAKLEDDFIERVSSRLNWDSKIIRKHLIKRLLPVQSNAKRGEFGETLISALLEQFAGYFIPVPKLQFKLTSGQSLPATDALAIKVDASNSITEVCYVESKLRTRTDNNAAVQAAHQLQHDISVTTPDILSFVTRILHKQNSPLADPFIDYLADRNDTREKDSHCIGLCWDKTVWTDTVLAN